MKKFLAMFLMVAMIASMLVVTGSAADTKVYKTYAEAAKGDLLWVVDFNAKDVFAPQGDANAQVQASYTVGDNGRSITVKHIKDDKKACYWGGPIKGLEVDDKAQATMTFKVKANGTVGQNNSTGIGGWLYDSKDASKFNDQFLNNYSNWNSDDGTGKFLNRAALSLRGSKKVSYVNAIDKAATDKDGFMSCKLEFNAAEMEYTVSYLGTDGKWFLDEDNYYIMEALDDKADSLCFMIYSYYLVVDTTIKDVKYFKGIGLTDAQLAAEAPKAPETTKAPVTTKAPETTKAPAATTKAPVVTPATADATTYIVLACAVVALTMSVMLKKKEH